MAEEEKKETIRKRVDESWKEDIKKEKKKIEEGKEKGEAEGYLPEADLRSFITGLVMQGFMFMGEIPDPVSKEKRKNLPQAKYIIDVLMMLREKMQGNMTEEEKGLLDSALHELQMKYVKAAEET